MVGPLEIAGVDNLSLVLFAGLGLCGIGREDGVEIIRVEINDERKGEVEERRKVRGRYAAKARRKRAG